MKILYWLFLLILIIGGVAHGLYGLFHFSFFSYLPNTIVLFKISLVNFVRIIIGISAIVILLANFSISLGIKLKENN